MVGKSEQKGREQFPSSKILIPKQDCVPEKLAEVHVSIKDFKDLRFLITSVSPFDLSILPIQKRARP